MSQENVEIVRRGYEAFNRGDIDGVVGLLAPDFEYVASGLVPGVGGRGAGGLRGFADTSWAELNDPRSRSMNSSTPQFAAKKTVCRSTPRLGAPAATRRPRR
jgi:ketosteroid isomerase-like protein